jgi:hypothetical protein
MISGCWCAGAWAQTTSTLTARELFYRDDAAAAAPASKTQPKKQPPKQTEPTRTAASKTANKAGETKTPEPSREVRADARGPSTPSGVPVVTASNLGVRYNVLLVTDRQKKTRKAVDPDSSFRAGDCFAVELTPNRDGYLYVFNAASSGAWQPLLPSSQMPAQENFVRRGARMVIPSDHCFEFDNTPGVERLLVVITEREEDQKRLSDSIRNPAPENQRPARPRESGTLLAGGALMRDLEMMRTGQLIGRDIKIAKVGTPQAEGEQPHAVYAVRNSTAPNERLMIEIPLRHE